MCTVSAVQDVCACQRRPCPIGRGREGHEFADERGGVGVALERCAGAGELGGLGEDAGDRGDAICLFVYISMRVLRARVSTSRRCEGGRANIPGIGQTATILTQ